jgi:hypothetical protein
VFYCVYSLTIAAQFKTLKPGINKMHKLLTIYIANPTEANKIKLQKYLNKHMMSVCCAPLEQQQYLKANGFII